MIYIVFIYPHHRPPLSTLWRKPRYWWGCWIGRWTSWLTRTPLAHCAVALDHCVVETTITGTRVLPREGWLNVQRIHGAFAVPEPWPVTTPPAGARRLPLVFYEPLRLFHYLSRGLIPCRQCITPVQDVMAAAGMPVPNRCTSPASLWKWLHDQGFKYRSVPRKVTESWPYAGAWDNQGASGVARESYTPSCHRTLAAS